MKTFEFENWTDDQWQADLVKTAKLYKDKRHAEIAIETYKNWVDLNCIYDKGDLQGHIEISKVETKSGHAEILIFEFSSE